MIRFFEFLECLVRKLVFFLGIILVFIIFGEFRGWSFLFFFFLKFFIRFFMLFIGIFFGTFFMKEVVWVLLRMWFLLCLFICLCKSFIIFLLLLLFEGRRWIFFVGRLWLILFDVKFGYWCFEGLNEWMWLRLWGCWDVGLEIGGFWLFCVLFLLFFDFFCCVFFVLFFLVRFLYNMFIFFWYFCKVFGFNRFMYVLVIWFLEAKLIVFIGLLVLLLFIGFIEFIFGLLILLVLILEFFCGFFIGFEEFIWFLFLDCGGMFLVLVGGGGGSFREEGVSLFCEVLLCFLVWSFRSFCDFLLDVGEFCLFFFCRIFFWIFIVGLLVRFWFCVLFVNIEEL